MFPNRKSTPFGPLMVFRPSKNVAQALFALTPPSRKYLVLNASSTRSLSWSDSWWKVERDIFWRARFLAKFTMSKAEKTPPGVEISPMCEVVSWMWIEFAEITRDESLETVSGWSGRVRVRGKSAGTAREGCGCSSDGRGMHWTGSRRGGLFLLKFRRAPRDREIISYRIVHSMFTSLSTIN